MKGLMKWPLIIAAIVVVLRIVFERLGAPDTLNNILSVVVLYVFICPVYFAIRIATSGVPRPYLTLLKMTALYTALARAMVIPTYWLAYIYGWPEQRFSVAAGGVVGPGVTPLNGYILTPLVAGIMWILVSLVAGGGLGSIVIAVKRRSAKKLMESVSR
ncbi:MAG TPA: hypothetical protein VE422_51160 [Terriglobia bacterium]|nr:hypothetical protein [Terriglobia bacterium]